MIETFAFICLLTSALCFYKLTRDDMPIWFFMCIGLACLGLWLGFGLDILDPAEARLRRMEKLQKHRRKHPSVRSYEAYEARND